MKKSGALLVLSLVAFVVAADVGTNFNKRPFPDARLFGAYAGPTSRPALYFSTREEFKPHGRVHVLVQTSSGWADAGEVAEDQHLRSQSIDLSRWGNTADITVKLVIEAPGAAHVDALLVDGKEPLGLDARLARKLAKADNDVVPYSEVAGRPLTFAAGAKPRLTIIGRIEAAVIGTEPFLYPTANTYKQISADSEFYRYQIGSARWSPTINGSLKGEALDTPFFKEVFPVGSGHPESPTWAWVGDDGHFLYAAIDFTADNTEDGTKDYTKVFARTPSGIREFKISIAEQKWGKVGFEYTDKVAWEHKVYEFAIPLAEIAPAGTDRVELAFAAYGTATPPKIDLADPTGVDPDAGSSGTTFTFTVKYTDPNNNAPTMSDVWIDLNKDGLQGAAPVVLPIVGVPPGSIIPLFILTGLAITLAGIRRKLWRVAPAIMAAVLLSSCPSPSSQTTQEVYPMSGSGVWSGGVVMTATVKIEKDPGTYNFQFKFKQSGDGDVTYGTAAGQLHLTIN